jgi:hypothetical protein
MNNKERIMDYLKQGKVLTRLNSWDELGMFEAPARICELRRTRAGRQIETTLKTVVNKFGEHVTVAEWSIPKYVAKARKAA